MDWSLKHNQPIELHWIGRAPALELIQFYCPDVACHDIQSMEKVGGRGISGLPAEIDACIDLQSNLRSRRLASQIRRWHGATITRPDKRYAARTLLVASARVFGRAFGRTGLGVMCQNALGKFCPPIPQYQLAALAMARALGEKSGAGIEIKPTLNAPEPDARLDRNIAWLAIAPGASYPAKKAPAQVFEQIMGRCAGKLPPDKQIGIVLLGDQRERVDCDEIERRLSANQWDGPVLNLAGSTTLAETVALLAGCHAILSNDSSLAHIAESLGNFAFMLFGPTTEAFGFAPHLPKSRAFSASLGCRPCSKHGKTPCRYKDHACFWAIDTRSAGDALAEVFS